MINVGYLEHHGDTQYRGGYHDACGDIMSTAECSVLWGIPSFVI